MRPVGSSGHKALVVLANLLNEEMPKYRISGLALLHGDIVPASQNTAMTHLVLEQVTGGHYDVLAEGQVVGHIMLSNAAPVATPWIWTLAYGFHDYRKRTRGYAATRDAALQAISESWQRE